MEKQRQAKTRSHWYHTVRKYSKKVEKPITQPNHKVTSIKERKNTERGDLQIDKAVIMQSMILNENLSH